MYISTQVVTRYFNAEMLTERGDLPFTTKIRISDRLNPYDYLIFNYAAEKVETYFDNSWFANLNLLLNILGLADSVYDIYTTYDIVHLRNELRLSFSEVFY